MSSSEIETPEQRLIRQAEPLVAEAYELHMQKGEDGLIGEDVPVEMGTVNPLGILNRFANLPPNHGISRELVGRVREEADHHFSVYEKKGVDLRPLAKVGLHMIQSTEVNLPHYYGEQLSIASAVPSYLRLLNRWTAEESFHGPLTEYYASMAGISDTALERRTQTKQIMTGVHMQATSIAATFAYTDPQEGATADTQENMGYILDEAGRRSMNAIQGNELKHQRMFRFILKGLFEMDPEYVMPIIAKTWSNFAMPGKEGIENFDDYAVLLAVAGIFNLPMLRAHQKDSADELGLLEEGIVTTPKALKAQKRIVDIVDMGSEINQRKQMRIDEAEATYIEQAKAAGKVPVIVGKTVVFNPQTKLIDILPEAA